MTVTDAGSRGFNLDGRVRRTVEAAAARAGVEVVEVEGMDELRAVSGLFSEVWGRGGEGAPMHSEAMRSMVHAGGLVSAAHDVADGQLLGAAVLGRDVPGRCYGYLAAVRPGTADRGIGWTLKQHQRLWALAHGMDTMAWTYDPLVSRNGRFNLTKLGATVREYVPAFYGQMSDEVNGTDVGDRMVVSWELRSRRALAAGEGVAPDPLPPDPGTVDGQVEAGPDGEPARVDAAGERWVRVPTDVVALRRTDPSLAAAWRSATATWFADAFAEGLLADSVSRTGWYHLTPEGAPA